MNIPGQDPTHTCRQCGLADGRFAPPLVGGLCPSCSDWFPKPIGCKCAYDAGWIYKSEECAIHEGLEVPGRGGA